MSQVSGLMSHISSLISHLYHLKKNRIIVTIKNQKQMDELDAKINEAAELLLNSKSNIAFTGAGISVESGIPPFRGKDGLWNKYDPKFIDINYFYQNPESSWLLIKEIFYDSIGKAKYNTAHYVLSKMEENSLLDAVITQNIDNLHQEAGSKEIHEFHGNLKYLICTSCNARFRAEEVKLDPLPPYCINCNHLLKPDFIFFGEDIPMDAYIASIDLAKTSGVIIVIGSTGKVIPACQIPVFAKANGSKVIEINPERSNFTDETTDIFLQGKATEVMTRLEKALFD